MANIWYDVDAALSEVPVNKVPLVASADGFTIDSDVNYDAAGLSVIWNFVTCAGAYSQTAVTPTTGGAYDWVEQGNGMFTIEIPASGGASISNDTEGFGWFTGTVTGCCPFSSPVYGFRRAALNDLFVEGGTASTNLEDFFDGTGYAGGTINLDVNTKTITNNAITASSINADAITNAKIADDAIAVENIKDAAITAAKIASDAIEAAKIKDAAFTAAKFAANAITSTVIADDAITAAKLNTGAIAADAFDQTAADKVWGTAARVLTANTNLADLAVDVTKIHGSALTETSGGYLAAGFTKQYDVATPVFTAACVNQGADNNVILASASKGLVKVYDDMSKPGTAQLVGSLSNDTITTLSIANGAITNAKVADDVDVNCKTMSDIDFTATQKTLLSTTGIKAASIPAVTGATLDAAYDAAKTAAAAGAKMDLIDAPNSTATTAIANAVNDQALEGTTTIRQANRLVLAGVAGVSTGGGTATIKFKDVSGAKDRITATVDASGNRTNISRDVS